MNEQSLMEDLLHSLECCCFEHGARRIRGVKVRLGAHAGSPEELRHRFTGVCTGTVADGASLEISTFDDAAEPVTQELLVESVELEGAYF